MTQKYSKQQIQDMLNAGLRQKDIAKALGATIGTISALIQRCGLHDPNATRRQVHVQRALSAQAKVRQVQAMLSGGMRQRDVAAALGTGLTYISRLVCLHGLHDPHSTKRNLPRPAQVMPPAEWDAILRRQAMKRLASAPIVRHAPKLPSTIMAKSDKPFGMSLTPLSQYLAAGRQTSAPRDA